MASKILRSANAPKTSPDSIELLVGQALIDLENNVADLKAELRPLQISAAREVDVKVRYDGTSPILNYGKDMYWGEFWNDLELIVSWVERLEN